MVALVAWLLVGWGVVWIVVRSEIGGFLRVPVATVAGLFDPPPEKPDRLTRRVRIVTAPFRVLRALLDCAGCTGFWIGAGIGWHAPLPGLPDVIGGPVAAIASGLALAGVAIVADAVYQAVSSWGRVAWTIERGLEGGASEELDQVATQLAAISDLLGKVSRPTSDATQEAADAPSA